jgi:hypothetical protein
MKEIKNAEKQDIWEDEDFLKELDARIEELESGKVKGVTLEELRAKAINPNR